MSDNILFHAPYYASKVGKTGLAVTIDVDKVERATGVHMIVVTGGIATEGRNGHYYYHLAGVTDLESHDYVGCFKTSDATVDAQHMHSGWFPYALAHADYIMLLDAAITTRLADADYTAPPSAVSVRDAILSDGTPFAGAHIDAAISSRLAGDSYAAAPTANQVRDVILSDSTPFAGANLDAAISSRLAATDYSAPLDAGATAAAVLDALGAAYNDPLSIGAFLNLLPAISQALAGPINVTVLSPVDLAGNVRTIQGDSYLAAHGRALRWSSRGVWPLDLTDATVKVVVDDEIIIPCTVVHPQADDSHDQEVACEPVGLHTSQISGGEHLFQVKAWFIGYDDPVTLVSGRWTSSKSAQSSLEPSLGG